MIGYSPADPDPGVDDPTRTEKSLAVSRKWGAVIDRHIHWTDPAVYHRRQLPLDIGLAPLRRGEFNLGKSDVKAIEYSISGAAVVCMRHPVFERAGWKHEENALLVNNQEEMGLATLRLLRDPVLRRDLVAAAREMVANERNDEVMRTEWMAACSP
jgi:glycosyltransferase involved in cell wall biosynthesis